MAKATTMGPMKIKESASYRVFKVFDICRRVVTVHGLELSCHKLLPPNVPPKAAVLPKHKAWSLLPGFCADLL